MFICKCAHLQCIYILICSYSPVTINCDIELKVLNYSFKTLLQGLKLKSVVETQAKARGWESLVGFFNVSSWLKLPYNGKFSRQYNFAVFVDLLAA